MKPTWKLAAALLVISLPAPGGSATLTTDPVTKLPIIPTTAGGMVPGNEPTSLPESQTCKSKMQTDIYTINHGKLSATVAWYEIHLPGFRKTRAFHNDRSQITFYNSDGTEVVSISGERGKDGEDVDADSVVYARYQPGLPEKEIVSMNTGHLVCN
jgi:hypothetical protein